MLQLSGVVEGSHAPTLEFEWEQCFYERIFERCFFFFIEDVHPQTSAVIGRNYNLELYLFYKII